MDRTTPPRDLPRTVLHPGMVCLDAQQPLGQCEGTLALITATLTAIRHADLCRITPSWARWYTALGGRN
jgi:hypothetical protein